MSVAQPDARAERQRRGFCWFLQTWAAPLSPAQLERYELEMELSPSLHLRLLANGKFGFNDFGLWRLIDKRWQL